MFSSFTSSSLSIASKPPFCGDGADAITSLSGFVGLGD